MHPENVSFFMFFRLYSSQYFIKITAEKVTDTFSFTVVVNKLLQTVKRPRMLENYTFVSINVRHF